jgi:hypothetical protein
MISRPFGAERKKEKRRKKKRERDSLKNFPPLNP